MCLAVARSISVAGNGFGMVALTFGVLTLPGAGAWTVSLVLACQAVSQVLLVLVGGALADRMSRSKLMVISEVGAALSWGGIAIFISMKTDALVVVCLLAATAGAATAMFTPAMTGVIPELVPREALQRANASIRIGQNIAMLLGLATSGLVVAAFGPAWALAADAVSFMASGGLIAVIRVGNPARTGATFLADLRTGGAEFFSRQWLWVVVAQFSLVVAAFGATMGVLGPLTAVHHYGGVRSWSVIAAAQAVGTIAGAGLAFRIRVARPIRVAVLVSLTFALPMLFLGIAAPVWLCAIAMFASGVATDVFGALWITTLQRHVPPHVLSRVSAYDILGSISIAPLGILIAGPVSTAIGTGVTLLGCAAVATLATLAALLSPEVRELTD